MNQKEYDDIIIELENSIHKQIEEFENRTDSKILFGRALIKDRLFRLQGITMLPLFEISGQVLGMPWGNLSDNKEQLTAPDPLIE